MDTDGVPSAKEVDAGALATKLRGQIAAAQAQLVQLEKDLADEEHDASLGALGAAARASDLRTRASACRDSIEAASKALQRANEEFTRLNSERTARMNMQRLRSIPPLTSQVRAQALEIEAKAAELGRLVNQHAVTCRTLGAAIGTNEAKRTLGFMGIRHRLQHCLVNDFAADDGRPEAARALEPTGNVFHWFEWPHNPASKDCKAKFSAATDEAVDTLDLVFASEKDARQVRARIDPAGIHVHPVKTRDGLWQLVRAQLRGAASRLPGGDKQAAD